MTMKRLTNLFVFTLCFGLASVHAQKRYDELTYPELNEFQKPEVETFTLDNGIKFFLVEDHELPLIDVSVNVRTGGVLVPNDKAGLASITGSVIRSGGSKNYPAEELNVMLENRAASMETGIGFTSGGAGMNVLKEDFDELLPVFIDLLQNPALPKEKIELEKKQRKSGISRRNDNQQQIGFREYERLIYGKNSRYGRMTEYATVDNITREDVVNFHKKYFVDKNMMVGVVGDFRTRDMKRKLTKAFSKIPAGTATTLDFPEVDYDYKNTINFIDKPDVNQSFVLMGHIGGSRDNPDYPKVQVMNEVLSGGFSGRLFQVVRTDMGLAYAVFGSYQMNSFYPGEFYTGVMTKSSTTAEAIDAIIGQIKRLQNEPVTGKELADVKDQFLNSMVFRFDSYEEVLNRRISYEYRGLPEDAFEKFIEGVRTTTIKDVQNMARKYLQPDQLQILVVGNEQEIGGQLQKYGDVNEIDITIPQPGSEEQQEVTGDAIKGRELLNKMAGALISPETSLNSIIVEGEIQRVNPPVIMSTTLTISYPDGIEQTVQTPRGAMTMKLEDGQGTMSMGGQQQPMPPPMAKGLKEDLNRSYLAMAQNNENLDPQYLGQEEFEGASYAKISVTIDDKNVTLLIDEKTGYPRLMRYRQFNPQQGKQVQMEQRYSNWAKNGGVAYAYKKVSFSDGTKQAEMIFESHTVEE